MWPWGHVAVAYLCYTAFTHRRAGRAPYALPTLALLVGSQFPDLLDKPLAWSAHVLPGGRTMAHSLLFAALVIPLAYAVAVRLDRVAVAIAFAVGHLAHLFADVPPAVLAGDFSGATYLFWPVVQPESYESIDGILAMFLSYSMGPYEVAQLGLFAVAAVVWYRDGAPGTDVARVALERLRRRAVSVGR